MLLVFEPVAFVDVSVGVVHLAFPVFQVVEKLAIIVKIWVFVLLFALAMLLSVLYLALVAFPRFMGDLAKAVGNVVDEVSLIGEVVMSVNTRPVHEPIYKIAFILMFVCEIHDSFAIDVVIEIPNIIILILKEYFSLSLFNPVLHIPNEFISIRIDNYRLPLLFILHPLPFYLLSSLKIHPLSFLLVVFPIALVHLFVRIEKSAKSMLLPLQQLSLVNFPVLKTVSALSFVKVIHPISKVSIPIAVPIDSLALFYVCVGEVLA